MKHDDPIARLFAEARAHLPFDDPGDFGFETRLRAAIREANPTLSESIAALSWRFSAAALPLLLLAAVVLALTGQTALPEGFGGFVNHCTSFLPIEL